MSQSSNLFKIIGKAVYWIGIMLFFNFFFGLLFFRFFYWLILGGILLVLFTGALSLGKNMIFSNFVKSKPSKSSTRGRNDVIDVEAEVCDMDDPKG